jgi:hypothetical protein
MVVVMRAGVCGLTTAVLPQVAEVGTASLLKVARWIEVMAMSLLCKRRRRRRRRSRRRSPCRYHYYNEHIAAAPPSHLPCWLAGPRSLHGRLRHRHHLQLQQQ